MVNKLRYWKMRFARRETRPERWETSRLGQGRTVDFSQRPKEHKIAPGKHLISFLITRDSLLVSYEVVLIFWQYWTKILKKCLHIFFVTGGYFICKNVNREELFYEYDEVNAKFDLLTRYQNNVIRERICAISLDLCFLIFLSSASKEHLMPLSPPSPTNCFIESLVLCAFSTNGNWDLKLITTTS